MAQNFRRQDRMRRGFGADKNSYPNPKAKLLDQVLLFIIPSGKVLFRALAFGFLSGFGIRI